MLLMPTTSLPRWTLGGHRKRQTQGDLEKNSGKMKEQGWTWGFCEGVTADRLWWRSLVVALCANLREED